MAGAPKQYSLLTAHPYLAVRLPTIQHDYERPMRFVPTIADPTQLALSFGLFLVDEDN
jgi:hypothetical protein